MEVLQKLKGWRTLIVVILGLGPAIAEFLNAIDLENGWALAIATGALAITGILRIFTNTPIFKRENA